jgi:hypothetical protein
MPWQEGPWSPCVSLYRVRTRMVLGRSATCHGYPITRSATRATGEMILGENGQGETEPRRR